MNIALCIGHDADRKGAYGSVGISEWNFNDELVSDFVLTLPKKHTYYVLYRNADIHGYKAKMVDLHNRIDNLNCELSIEFHFNSFSDENVKGHEVLACSNGGMEFAKSLNDSFDQFLPTSNRGAKRISIHDRGGSFCCLGRSKAIISEAFFGSEQHHFVVGGWYRDLLIDAYTDFFNKI